MNENITVVVCDGGGCRYYHTPLIGVDMDGVLANFNDFFLKRINNLLGTAHLPEHITAYDYHDCIPIEREFVYEVFDEMAVDGSYNELESIPGYWSIENLPGHVRLVTNRQARCQDATIAWLKRHDIWRHEDIVFVVGAKSQVGEFDYFIEDSLKNALDMSPLCGVVYLVDCPYNQADDLPANIVRVKDLEAAVQEINLRESVYLKVDIDKMKQV
jgi:uncharacterized HAD superfamily protein